MMYPKSLFRNDGGNWVGRTAKDADEEEQLKSQGFSDLVIGNPKPKQPAPAPFFPPVPEKAKPEAVKPTLVPSPKDTK